MEKAIVNAFSSDDKDDDKDKRGGGILSLFGGDKDDDKDKDDGGLFSFGRDDEKKKNKKEDDDNGFFSKLLNRDDDDDKHKKSGFKGLFNEQQGAAGYIEGEEDEGFEGGSATISGGGSGISDGGEETLTHSQVLTCLLPPAGQQ